MERTTKTHIIGPCVSWRVLGLANFLQGRRLCSKRRKDVVVKFKCCIIKVWDATKQMKHTLCINNTNSAFIFLINLFCPYGQLFANYLDGSFFLRLQIVVPDVPEIVSVDHFCSIFANCHSQQLFFCKSFWIYILCKYCTYLQLVVLNNLCCNFLHFRHIHFTKNAGLVSNIASAVTEAIIGLGLSTK